MSATRRRLAALAALAAVLAPRSLAAASQMPAAGGAQQLLAGGGASDTSSAASWTSPPFCHGLECPRYSTLPCAAKGVELRRYAPSTWVSTVVTGASYDDAVNQVRASARRERACAHALSDAAPRAPRACVARVAARVQGFGLLFSYISGANAAGVKIPMTAPVATDVAPGAGCVRSAARARDTGRRVAQPRLGAPPDASTSRRSNA